MEQSHMLVLSKMEQAQVSFARNVDIYDWRGQLCLQGSSYLP